MDRRSFVLQAGLVAAGSAFSSPLMGCDSIQPGSAIPCLGPAVAPAPVPGMTYIRASQIGCALDCDLSLGINKCTGGTATDDAPRINAAMAGASATNPITLIIDGSALISGLYLPAGGYWSIAGLGCGTGFFIKTGANSDGIHNGPPNAGIPQNPGPPVPDRGSSVSLSNFTLNGNAGNGRNGDSTTGARQGNLSLGWYFCINLMNLNNITIENVVVVNSPSFHFLLSNVGSVKVSGCVMKSVGVNTDGLHFDGPANDISISNCDFIMGDDAIALNCPEGYGGDISRVSVTDCTFNSITSMRLYTIPPYSSLAYNIDTVKVSNCSGTAVNEGFLIGTGMGSKPHSVDGLTISNCSLTTPAILDISANFGTVALNNVTQIPLRTPTPPSLAFVRTSSIFDGMTYTGESLTLTNCVITQNADFVDAAIILENNSTINNLIFNGFAIQNASGKTFPPAQQLVNANSGTIGQLVLNAVSPAGITAPVSSGGFSKIGSVSGTGVLATGWQFPNAVMSNNVPYISANSGLPSIKINGVVEPYPQS